MSVLEQSVDQIAPKGLVSSNLKESTVNSIISQEDDSIIGYYETK